MPYIKPNRRENILTKKASPLGWQKFVVLDEIKDAGELNYAISEMIFHYLKQSKGKYQDLNDIVGALEGAKAEFQRRVVAPYEDLKIEENGDVYEP